MSWVNSIQVKWNNSTGYFDVTVRGNDPHQGEGGGACIEWTDRVLQMQGVEQIIKSIRINSSL